VILLSKIIAVFIIINGIIDLLFPSFVKGVAESFKNEFSPGEKRVTGLIYLIIGVTLFYLTRIYLETPAVHWVIAVTGVYMFLFGTFIAAFPQAAGRIASWFYSEKEVTPVIGLILIALGTVIYFLI